MAKKPHLFRWKDVARVINGTESYYCNQQDYENLIYCRDLILAKLALFLVNCPQFKDDKTTPEPKGVDELPPEVPPAVTPPDMPGGDFFNLEIKIDKLIEGQANILNVLNINFMPLLISMGDKISQIDNSVSNTMGITVNIKRDVDIIKEAETNIFDTINTIVSPVLEVLHDGVTETNKTCQEILRNVTSPPFQ